MESGRFPDTILNEQDYQGDRLNINQTALYYGLEILFTKAR